MERGATGNDQSAASFEPSRVLSAVSKAASSIKELMELAAQAVSADACVFWARRLTMLRTQAHSLPMHLEDLDVDLRLGEGVAGRVALQRVPLIVPDLLDAEDLRHRGIPQLAHQPVVERMGWRSGCYVPIVIDNRLLGVVAAFSGQTNYFLNDQSLILGIFGERVAARLRVADLNTRYERMVKIGTSAMERVHDIREETGAIQSNVDGIMRIVSTATQEELEKRLRAIRDLAGHSQSMADQTLRQVVADRSKPRLQRLKPLLEEAVESRRQKAEEARILLDLRCENKLAAVCWEREVVRAINNLVDNSIFFLKSYRPAVGPRKVDVAARIIRGAEGLPTKTCMIQVSDNGPGIPAKDRPFVFDFGFSGKGGQGLGIGMAYVESVIEACGGTIELEDSAEYSTIVTITLPGRVPDEEDE